MTINYYLTGMRKPVLIFRDAHGLFWYDRYKAIVEAAVNLLSSILLAKYFGIFRVLLGTMISTISVCLWVEPFVLFKYGIKEEKMVNYFLKFAIYTILTLVAGGLSYMIGNYLAAGHVAMIRLVVKGIVCVIVTSIVFLMASYKMNEFVYVKELCQKVMAIFVKKNKK